MNMNKPDPVEDEIDAIRIKLYERTKNMTAAERVDFFNKGAREILEQQGVNARFVKSVDHDAHTA